jgi:hypothetical protein
MITQPNNPLPMKVEIYFYNVDRRKKELSRTWTLDKNGYAICDKAFDQESKEIHGAVNDGRIYYPKDGEDFLRSLPWEYANSSMVHAVIVE